VTPQRLEIEVNPPWPFRLSARGRGDGVLRTRRGIVTRFMHAAGRPVVVHAWQRSGGEVVLQAIDVGGGDPGGCDEALELALERMRFALCVDDDLSDFYATFRRHPLLGPAIRHRPWLRVGRRPWPWEALAWAVTEQLIELERAHAIQRRIVWRWGEQLPSTAYAKPLHDAPCAATIAGRAPAELTALDLAPKRALALIRVAREVNLGRIDPARAEHDKRLLAIPEIGPWTVQCLGLRGRGEPDSLPAGDLGYVKLIGRLRGEGRRATVEEVEEYFAPYEPYRGWAGAFILAELHKRLAGGPPLKLAA
jgi:3-methyladenine DNA glycosylase/8-oxoguanine DNA glycosylase